MKRFTLIPHGQYHRSRRFFRTALLFLFCLLLPASAWCKGKDSVRVTIFGDSYSTFEGYLTPDTNEVWYFTAAHQQRANDVNRVEQTW